MAISDVGLNYVSKNAGNFIKDAEKITGLVSKLNFELFLFGKQADNMESGFNRIGNAARTAQKLLKDNHETILELATGQKKLSEVTILNSTSFKKMSDTFNNAKQITQGIISNNGKLSGTVEMVGNRTRLLSGEIVTATRNTKAFSVVTNFLRSDFLKKIPVINTLAATLEKSFGAIPLLIKKIVPDFTNMGVAFGKLKTTIMSFGSGAGIKDIFSNLLGIIKAIPPQVLIAVAAFAAFKVVGDIFESIGKRAAGLTAVATAFEKLRQNAGLATTYLKDFTAEADNQLTRAETLVLANKALAGSVGEFQQELAASLPTLLEFARVRSAATGEEVNWLFESLIQGIKKGQPLILDNIGLVVKLEETYKNYAAALGVSVEALTGVQKQQAILNAVNLEAVRNIGIFGAATLSNTDKMRAVGNIMTDILDGISLAFQPLFGAILDIQMYLAGLFSDTLAPFISIFQSAMSFLGAAITAFFNNFKPLLDFISALIVAIVAPFEAIGRVIAKIAPLIAGFFLPFGPFLLIAMLLGKALSFLIPLLEKIAMLFSTLADVVIGLIDFIGFLGQALIDGVTKALFPTQELTQSVDTLKVTIEQTSILLAVGFGKAIGALVNVMAGAAKNILKIVADLAQGIADFLIGESPPPKGPLSKIDTGGAAVFEAWMGGFTSVTLEPVEKVAENVDSTLGNIGALSLPQVEGRIAKLDKALRPFEEQLSIVQSRFEAIQKPAEAALNAIDRQLDKAVEALTKGDSAALNSVKALDAQRAAIYKNLDLQQQQVDSAQIQLALKQAQQAEERALLEIQKKRLSGKELTQQEKLTEAKIKESQAAKEAAKTAGGSGAAQTGAGGESSPASKSPTGNPFADYALEGFASELDLGIFDDIASEQERLGEQGGRIGEGLAGLPDRFTTAFAGVFGENGTIRTFINGVFGPTGFFATKINEFTSPDGVIATNFNTIFGEGGTFATIITGLFGEGGTFGTQVAFATTVFEAFGTAFTGIADNVIAVLTGEQSIQTAFTNIFGEEGILSGLMAQAQNLFWMMYQAVFGPEGIFAGVGERMRMLIAVPIVAMLEGLENLINSFISIMEGFLNGIIDQVEGLVEYIPTELRGSLGDIIGYELVIPRVNFTPPAIEGAAKGGLFTGGMLEVGERGRELIASASSKMAVFPNNFVTAIESLESVLVNSMNIPSSGNSSNSNYNYNSSSNQTVNINQPMNPTSLRQQLSLMG